VTTPIAVTIAGSDSGGGAGIQADLKTFSALGVYGASVITALTAQNTVGVQAIHDVPAEFVAAQMDSVFGDLAVGAAKIGMLSRAEIMEAVRAGLDRHHVEKVVLDPVMVTTTGHRLIAPDATAALIRLLLPRAIVITPNLHEAAVLLDEPVAENEEAMLAQARRLLALGARAVLMKGGHGSGDESADLLVTPAAGCRRYAARRVQTRNTHGTGCTLSAAIAAGLAKGQKLETAVASAKDYLSHAIAAADSLHVGHGSGPVHHFHALWGGPVPKPKESDVPAGEPRGTGLGA
jgi:hydroxymethylpyrimidine/phosphomethylpyrimidine kinase